MSEATSYTLHTEARNPAAEPTEVSSSHAAVKVGANSLLTTCRVLIVAPDDSSGHSLIMPLRLLYFRAFSSKFVTASY